MPTVLVCGSLLGGLLLLLLLLLHTRSERSHTTEYRRNSTILFVPTCDSTRGGAGRREETFGYFGRRSGPGTTLTTLAMTNA